MFTTPWAGFLFGFPVAAFFAGYVMEHTRKIPVGFAAGIGSIVGGIFVLYGIAIPYYMLSAKVDLGQAALTMIPFMPGDIIKAVFASLIVGSVYKSRPNAILSRI